jgi:hypothetical protein
MENAYKIFAGNIHVRDSLGDKERKVLNQIRGLGCDIWGRICN